MNVYAHKKTETDFTHAENKLVVTTGEGKQGRGLRGADHCVRNKLAARTAQRPGLAKSLQSL